MKATILLVVTAALAVAAGAWLAGVMLLAYAFAVEFGKRKEAA